MSRTTDTTNANDMIGIRKTASIAYIDRYGPYMHTGNLRVWNDNNTDSGNLASVSNDTWYDFRITNNGNGTATVGMKANVTAGFDSYLLGSWTDYHTSSGTVDFSTGTIHWLGQHYQAGGSSTDFRYWVFTTNGEITGVSVGGGSGSASYEVRKRRRNNLG